MIDKQLAFELFTILLLLTLGTLVIMAGLPGWGLITVACLIGGSSIVMRTVQLSASSV
ncbi:hypothetical protein ADIMK_0858 [Marinobacterium lacunae]|uniref:Uncharacterized protein n=1 Tax=Marinobacterium lacunae TaxID=1232683 RepID=A0A081G301_9GAMM|nr:hypothetical protein [Marinobacterium lacunae]KEA65156.1 hypothetical protein ADIMK_0858 [Marinobacterium lacunae]MBR9884230.1 hypothetical protein [Oceanospirillales bacterium]